MTGLPPIPPGPAGAAIRNVLLRMAAGPPAAPTEASAGLAVPLADRIVVINLDRRPDRLRAFAQQADRIPQLAGWVRFSAFDGWAEPGPGHARTPPGARPTPGDFAICRSHATVLEDALAAGAERLAVFEDDALFAPGFSARLPGVLAAAPSDWQGLLLGGVALESEPAAPGFRRVTGIMGTYAYVVRGPAAMRQLHDLWAHEPGLADDGCRRWLLDRPVYQFLPVLCGHAAGPSDAANIHWPADLW